MIKLLPVKRSAFMIDIKEILVFFQLILHDVELNNISMENQNQFQLRSFSNRC